jgi:predicted  nucleic acid-binding Zn-ribbon protein
MEKISVLKTEKSKLKSRAKKADKILKNAEEQLGNARTDLEVSSQVVKDLEATNARLKIKIDRLDLEKSNFEKLFTSETSKNEQLSINYQKLSHDLDQL